MPDEVSITCLVEDRPTDRGLHKEHGLSFWIEADGRSLLFDTGQGEVLESNAYVLGVDLESADAVVLSHGHYDHSGGLVYLMKSSRHPKLYLHPEALLDRYSRRRKAGFTSVGMTSLARRTVHLRNKDVVWTEKPVEVVVGIHVTGAVPRRSRFEDTGGAFFLDMAGFQRDQLTDDQALYMETPRGLVVVLGCAHAGVVNTLDYVCRLTGSDSICAVLGGMHLVNASDYRLTATVAALERFHVQVIAPSHCTGRKAMRYLKTNFTGRYHECVMGTRFVV